MEYGLDHMDDLIGKVLTGEASGPERLELDQWQKENAENQKYFEQVKTVFNKSASPQVLLQFNTDEAWLRVKSKLNNENSTITLKPKFWPPLRIAAGIIILITAGIFGYQWFNQPVQTLTVVSDSAPVQDTLPDGSTAFLNKKSSISYQYNPREKTRKVILKGEGFFEVKHETEKPFVIEANETLVRDLGTAFNVNAYPDKDSIEVIVQSGEVQFYTLNDEGITLKAGETGVYSKSKKIFIKALKTDSNELAYRTRVFNFNSVNLSNVIMQINKVYGSNIKLGNQKLSECKLTAGFNNESIETIVDIIVETLGLTVERTGGEIILNGSGCQ